jgi:endoglucanase
MSKRLRARSLTGLAVAAAIIVGAGVAEGRAGGARQPGQPLAHAAHSSGCADQNPSSRDAANPLLLPAAPGASNPLRGATFFVDGPAHGPAAGAIARLLGIDTNVPTGHWLPSFDDSVSYQRFLNTTVAQRLPNASPSVQRNVGLLEKIASEPGSQRFSAYAEGGTPAGLTDFARKLFCHNFTADPNTIPVISTYFLHAELGGCSSSAQINADAPRFKAQIDAIVQAVGNRPAVWLLEIDALGSSACMARHGSLTAWERLLRYEVDRFASLPHGVVYVEGGYSDSNSARYTARALEHVDIGKIQGFFTNDTHNEWTIREIRWGEQISKLTGGTHFIVNTGTNGQGPKLNPHPSTQGIEDLCNPPGRGLGPRPTTDTGFPHVDAFLWTHPPGNSGGGCRGGPPAGTFWTAGAIGLAARANGRLGPGFSSDPY